MKYLYLTLLLFPQFSHAETPQTQRLEALLNLDRFETYTEYWAGTMRGRGKPELADAIHKFGPADFEAMKLNPAKLADAKNYDDLILEVLKKKHPELKATAADVEWGYNFFKMKMNEGYLLKDVAPRKTTPDPVPMTEARRNPTPLEMTALQSEEVLLDVDGYASDRTTRAVFWEASDSKRQIELFTGGPSHFLDEMTRRGAKVIGEVGTKARNYNPIYLVQNPGETGFHYAITEISGADRLKHFQLQSSLIRWQQANGKLAPPPPVNVVGNAAAVLVEEERALSAVLKNIPRADHVVIGQKGAFERTFGSLGKIESIMKLQNTQSAAASGLFDAKELKIIARAGEAGKDLPAFVMKYASDIDKLYKKATPLLTQHNLLTPGFTSFNYDRGTYEMSDYIVRGADGKPQRWRIFSNVWGDEVLPIAGALKGNGYNSVNYIGTAGAFQGTNLKVGDLVIPKTAANIQGEITPIPRNTNVNPQMAKSVEAVINVQSPFEETRDWLNRAGKVSQVVEVETGYLASVFTNPNDNLNVQLLISDVVGSEGETLATATSAKRRSAQISAISEIIQDAGVVSTGAVAPTDNMILRWIQEIVPTRDPASVVQIAREAHLQGITTKPALEAFIKTQKSFTTGKLEAVLRTADAYLTKIVASLRSAKVYPSVSFGKNLFDGRFNPSTGGVNIHFSGTPEEQAKAKAIADEIAHLNSDFKKSVNLSFSASSPPEFVPQGSVKEVIPNIKFTAQTGILQYGGLAHTENANGGLKFVRVGDVSSEAINTDSAFQISSSAMCSTRNVSEVLDKLLR